MRGPGLSPLDPWVEDPWKEVALLVFCLKKSTWTVVEAGGEGRKVLPTDWLREILSLILGIAWSISEHLNRSTRKTTTQNCVVREQFY